MKNISLNELITNEDNTKRFRIVKVNTSYVVKYVHKFETPLGGNSVGNEVKYDSLELAISQSVEWLLK
jgi:hypothetical protein